MRIATMQRLAWTLAEITKRGIEPNMKALRVTQQNIPTWRRQAAFSLFSHLASRISRLASLISRPELRTTRIQKHAALVAAAAMIAACGGGESEAATEGPAPTVVSQQDVATARRDTLRAGPVLAGSLEPATIVRLEAQIAGTIGDLRVDRGSPVRRGQVLAVIAAQGVRGQAAGARAQVAAAEANVALMRQRMEAARTLSEAGAMSRLDYEAARSAFEAAQAQLAAARAQSASASEDASRAVITSPITGAVSDLAIEEGEAISVGNPVLTVVNTDRLELSGQIPVEASAQVRVGQPVEFSLDAYPNRQFRGTVARMDPRADRNTRQVGVYVQLPNPGGSIIAGQFARGRVLGEAREATVVPLAAVRTLQADNWVLAIVDGKVQRRNVTLGSRDEARGLVEILSGVQPGEMVLAVPNAQIDEGTEVTVTGGRSPTAIPGSDSAATLRPGPNPASPRPATPDPQPSTEES